MKIRVNNRPRQGLLVVLASYGLFCGLSWLGRSASPLFGLVVLLGIGWPLLWAWRTSRWMDMGFTWRKLRPALLWGLVAGVLSGLLGLAVMGQFAAPSNLLQQLLVGVPMWALVASPFQEFFFRGWLQSELSRLRGEWWGLLLATAAFTLWHYLSPIVDLASFPLSSPLGVLSTFAAGWLYGFAFHRSKNLVAPWLAHTVTGVIFIVAGTMDFVQAMG